MKNLTTFFFLLIIFSVTENTYSHQIKKDEIIFIREYREYGWKEYGSNGAKLPRPIQTLVDFYLLEYRLNDNHLTISKLLTSNSSVRILLFDTLLNQTQHQTAQKMLNAYNPVIIEQQYSNKATIIDDGFHIEVISTKAGNSRNFSWHGNYIPELVNILNVINEASLEKYRFYKLGHQEIFRQALIQTTGTP